MKTPITIELNQGEHLLQPRLVSIKSSKKLSVSKAGAPTRIVSKINVSNDVHSLGNSDTESRREQSVNETGRNQLPHNSMDDKDLDSRVSDEFDDDEFDEDEFED